MNCNILANEPEEEAVVILEAFAKYLHSADQGIPAPAILGRWLWERLSIPPETIADRVLRAEISLVVASKNSNRPQVKGWSVSAVPGYLFNPTSGSGRRLLRSLYEYASSYEQQKWSRWVHCVKASDFNRLYNKE